MEFGDAVRDGFSKYATFSGRSSRSAYWYWFLFAFLASLAAGILDAIIGTVAIRLIVGLALFLPGLAVLARRYHDAGHSAWWILLLIVPLVGLIVWLIFTLTASKPPNEWGQGPDNVAGSVQSDPPNYPPPS